MRTFEGRIVASPEDLWGSFSSFYSSLVSAEPTDADAQESLLDNIKSSLSAIQLESCEGLLSVEECYDALSGMAKLKAPGLDGLPAEFYLKFWHVLGQDLVHVLNSCYTTGSLTLSQCRGVTLLSFKKGDRLDMRNWRTISLLNVDYKLAARAIAARLLKVIHLVVPEDQTCGVPGRYMSLSSAMWSLMPLRLTLQLSSCLWIRRRPLIEWIGPLRMPLFGKWGLAILFLCGLTCFTLVFKVLLM